jgi:hypothetical protein
LVRRCLRKFRQRFVGRLFLAESFVQQLDGLGEAKFFRPGLQRPVTRNLVVLDRLGGGNQASVD